MISGGRDYEEIERKKSERNRSKNRAKTGLYETSQPKEIFCEISTLLPNHSATHWNSLRKFSQLRSRVWHTSATSQHRSPHFAAAKRLRSSKAWKSLISQPKFHSAGYFVIVKAILAHMCHFAAQWYSIRSCETHCEVGCENDFFCEIGLFLRNSKWPLIFRYFYIYRSFDLRKGFKKRTRHSCWLFISLPEPDVVRTFDHLLRSSLPTKFLAIRNGAN